jgi:hypothetical protein
MRRLAKFGILESNPEEVFTEILGYLFAVLGYLATTGFSPVADNLDGSVPAHCPRGFVSGLIDTHQARQKEYGTLGSFLGRLLSAMNGDNGFPPVADRLDGSVPAHCPRGLFRSRHKARSAFEPDADRETDSGAEKHNLRSGVSTTPSTRRHDAQYSRPPP